MKMTLKSAKAGSGAVSARPTASSAGQRAKTGRSSQSGMLERSRGGITSVSSRCCTMWTLKR